MFNSENRNFLYHFYFCPKFSISCFLRQNTIYLHSNMKYPSTMTEWHIQKMEPQHHFLFHICLLKNPIPNLCLLIFEIILLLYYAFSIHLFHYHNLSYCFFISSSTILSRSLSSNASAEICTEIHPAKTNIDS